jgi:hypothetical protein
MAREQFELSETHSRLLTKLMEECELPTKKATLENALTILGWAVKEIKNGRTIASVDEQEKRYRELTMPALEAVRRHHVPMVR